MNIKDVLEKNKKVKNAAAKKKTAKNVAIGAGIGSAVGLAAGILLAPESGKKTRENIANNAKKAVDGVKQGVEKAKDKVVKLTKKEEISCQEANNVTEETSEQPSTK